MIKCLNWDDLQFKQQWPLLGWHVYCQAKLANILFTYELARKLKYNGITANCLHPGFVRSGLAKNNGMMARLITSLLSLAARRPENAAETVIWAATSDEFTVATGKYLVNQKITSSSAYSYNKEEAERLWHISKDLTGI